MAAAAAAIKDPNDLLTGGQQSLTNGTTKVPSTSSDRNDCELHGVNIVSESYRSLDLRRL